MVDIDIIKAQREKISEQHKKKLKAQFSCTQIKWTKSYRDLRNRMVVNNFQQKHVLTWRCVTQILKTVWHISHLINCFPLKRMNFWKVCKGINYLYLSFICLHFYFQVTTLLIRIWEALVMLSTHIATLTLNQPVRPVSHQDKRSSKRRNG